jgi:hypothetical protein
MRRPPPDLARDEFRRDRCLVAFELSNAPVLFVQLGIDEPPLGRVVHLAGLETANAEHP